MNRILTGALGFFLLGSQAVFSEVAPVKYLAGKSENGQPHLYWFGAAASQSLAFYDDWNPELFAYVSAWHINNQALVHFNFLYPIPPQPDRAYLLTEISALLAPGIPPDTTSSFLLVVRKDNGTPIPEEYLFLDTVTAHWGGQASRWVTAEMSILLFESQQDFWAGLQWMESTSTDPLVGRDYSDPGLNSYACTSGVCFQPYLGSWMIRARVMSNDSAGENADSFWVYRGIDSNYVFHVATADSVSFNYCDSPSGDDYYYRVSRWQNGEESPLSNAIRLTASPTAVEDREAEKHAFLLSEPLPNPTSAGVLFTAQTDREMPLGFSIYNLLGQKVFSKPAASYAAGTHPFFWNGQDASDRRLPSGLYLLRFQAGEEVLVKKITLLR